MTKYSKDPYVFFSDGIAVEDDIIVVAAGFTEAPEARTSRIYLKFFDEWLAHEVEHDFITSVAYQNGVVFALGKNGLVKTVGNKGMRLTSKSVRGKFRDFLIEPAEERGQLQRVKGIADDFYACGWGGQIYKLSADSWSSFEQGLDPKREDDFLDIDGSSASDLYVVGMNGTVAHFDGLSWQYVDLPTNSHIFSVKCLAADDVVLVGSNGCLFRGNNQRWLDLTDPENGTNLWAVSVLNGELYISYGDNGLCTFKLEKFADIRIANKNPLTHRLDATRTALWSFGSNQLFKFDGKIWIESVCPDNT
jgi:hypothetical protein